MSLPLRLIQFNNIPVNIIVKQYNQPPVNVVIGNVPGLKYWADIPFTGIEYIIFNVPVTIMAKDSFTETYKYIQPNYHQGEGYRWDGSLLSNFNVLEIEPINNFFNRVYDDKYINPKGDVIDTGYFHIVNKPMPLGYKPYMVGPIPTYNRTL